MRSFDHERLNALANDPSIRPFIGFPDAGELDTSELIDDHNNVALTWEFGAFVFTREDQKVYELHTMILPEGRGAPVIPNLHDAFKWLFANTPCETILTKTALDHKAANLVARRAGFQELYYDAKHTFFALTMDAWIDSQKEAEQCH